ncbi:C-X-C motif chemokine 11 [Onychomys torridus]|uniref:C-X-C motif chemokine 11 n=1 Tax=Onychomys torridus TaxID=38674 RepID=UPI00167FD04B|nr:C-X-C motif chemokine 11 [Onychomys torridus]
MKLWRLKGPRTGDEGRSPEHQSQGGAAAATEVNMKGTAIALAVIICATVVQGFSMFKRGRCLCIDPRAKAVKLAAIETVSIIYPSNSCDKVEVIITLKAHKGQICLDPKSKQARLIRQAIERKTSLRHKNKS